MKLRLPLLALVAMLALPATSSAAIVFDSTTGTGFVGKGDVQLQFGWNNTQLQKNASSLKFSYDATATYEGVCTWTTGDGKKGEKTHNVDHTTRSGVSSIVAYDARTKNQVTGFNLTGFGTTTTTGGEIPVVDGPCMGNEGHDGTWSSVALLSSTGGLVIS